jgi:hypothetical protein
MHDSLHVELLRKITSVANYVYANVQSVGYQNSMAGCKSLVRSPLNCLICMCAPHPTRFGDKLMK